MARKEVHLGALGKEKKVLLLCLAGVLTVLLLYWRREIMHGVYAIKRRADVCEVMNAHAHTSGRQYGIRGPLTIVQVEVELFRRPLVSGDIAEMHVSDDLAKAWNSLRGNYQVGDEFYFVESDERSWAQLGGWRGYVLIRRNKIVGTLTKFMN